jgi:hypothetical protein
MKKVKEFTKSISWLLVAIIAGIYGWVLGVLFGAFGLTAAIDSLYGEINVVRFWLIFMCSRWLFVAFWVTIVWGCVLLLRQSGWLYFRPTASERSSDVPGMVKVILISIVVLFGALLLGELSIRGRDFGDPFSPRGTESVTQLGGTARGAVPPTYFIKTRNV